MGARPANDILHAYWVSTRSVWIKPVEEALQLDCQMLQQLCLVVLCSQKAIAAQARDLLKAACSWPCRQHKMTLLEPRCPSSPS